MLYYSLETNTEDLTITGESVHEMAGVCLKVAKQCTPGPAAAAMRDGLEKLMAQGWSRRTTPAPSRAISPAPRTTGALTDDGSVAVDPLLSRDALQDADVPHPLRNPAIPQNQQESTAAQTMDVEEPPPILPLRDDQSTIRDAVMSNDTSTSNISNAFEGALDGLDFGVDPFGMDSMSWYTSTWIDPETGRPPDGMLPPGIG
ncbi:putative s-adenosylmethionine decarboxylase proenzyme protein [Phaeoacremonium minimum UCRPA7]|uniref:Putative s-adenosylmethionine decarboxylase proenzyme protein n=1 Tax=Phaeoacremonium minimum (strain UCR-PA7) TaxID=1286976 RepID=R8BLE8_PHAM7|nr:putative s-adenosylmethionine decarboxylase proenzyme protein [Phaeoacremonium minimum UCRPA7]EOO00179.1 putative s-adenosylmethionine decarboxylase proenzyme protein [Phaeoacremonium minimum UCRPA7]